MMSVQSHPKFLIIFSFLIFTDLSCASAEVNQDVFDQQPEGMDHDKFVARHKIVVSHDEASPLFKKLAQTTEDRTQNLLANAILKQWAQSHSDTAMLLLSRSTQAEKIGEKVLARKLVDDVVSLEPNWSEGFVYRARLRMAQKDIKGAITDLESALQLEPRRFDALELLGRLNEANGDQHKALEAYQKALEFLSANPQLLAQEQRLRFSLEQEKH